MATRSVLLALVVLNLLFYVPPGRSGPNVYIQKIFASCWRLQGTCRPKCLKNETISYFGVILYICGCVNPKYLPILTGK
ncbi:beta-defensin 135 precursor [Pan troglodytes]|uniref:Beta-defensin 135 n=1 Tax=Pan troglodytes TaxID=9598 RepID=DB135_PANTR|nr:beta-defensin 135 precursor [Pan troglodytes]Q30KJ4.1 RecName: Full=Beta-defensin 135; AltName: Full=Defensin, beta 135; Flags: Precursor [Pan troglodytes]AAY59816.1 beta-defensin 135 [Pan troglodytes troglodytes]